MLRLQGLSPGEVGAATALGWQFETRDMVTHAIDWISAGWESPTLYELAGVGWDDSDAKALWPKVLEELAITRPERPEALHVLARWLVGRWEECRSLHADEFQLLRDSLTHGAHLRAGAAYPWPSEQTMRALSHVGSVGGGGRIAATHRIDDVSLCTWVRHEVAATLGGTAHLDQAAPPGPESAMFVDRTETIRRLVAVAPDFAWEDVELDDNECSGTWEHEDALLGWTASRAAEQPSARVIEPMAGEIELLLTRSGPTAAAWATDFVSELAWHALRQGVDVDAVAVALGPTARPIWSDRARYWASGKSG